MSNASLVDLALPIAALLKSETATVHDAVEQSPGAVWLASGQLDREEYIRFLMMLWHVYDTLEAALEKHSSHPVIQSTHNPSLLSRAPNISADLSYLLHVDHSAWTSHPMHVALMASPPPALAEYLARLQRAANSDDPSALVAHAYVRYLGDLSGGQEIRMKIAKAYGLSDGCGTTFYEFAPLEGSGLATRGDMKKIKDRFRQRLDAAIGDDAALKLTILQEAILAFELTGGIFASLRPPSVPSKNMQEEDSKLVFSAEPQERTVQISSVIAVVAAMSLAHFLLVVGGFTGDKGLAKLEAIRDWFIR
ncbi:uncharacterized protein FIBRA_07124 [Fibroporia radiculosa]|uniref:heme oxygenase (biliverdin-producing) n=1 Tax=Fibroporia radiculosa TaxID=599839 RepID=J4I073_9APHY|nr:uncharacterized protein FIBRA_07124 [Fibroporia radiculosa]CCM04927.1 predicted protein [Fibroporia radiculosa]